MTAKKNITMDVVRVKCRVLRVCFVNRVCVLITQAFLVALQNVFVKPNEQNRACSSYAMARKRRMKSNEKQDANKKMKDDRKLSSS